MNILFLDSVDKKTFGGYQNWISLISIGLIDKGHNVFVAGRPGSEYLRRVGQASDRICKIPLNISGDFNPFTIRRLRNIIEREKIDIIICDFNKDVRLGGLAARLSSTKPRVIWRLGLDITKNNFLHRSLTPRLINAVAVPSLGLKNQITRFGYLDPDHIKVIPHGIPERKFNRPDKNASQKLRAKYNLPEDSIIAVTSGRLVTQKGHIYLVEAASDIAAREPRIRFLLLGDGPLEDSLRKKMTLLEVEKYFVFAGMLDNLDLELAGSDLMLHPSIDEPFGFSVLEGMRAGLPIVATNVGGIPEVVEEGKSAFLINARSPGEITEAALKLIGDENLQLVMGLAGQKRWREHLSLEIMIDRWENYLKDILNGSGQ